MHFPAGPVLRSIEDLEEPKTESETTVRLEGARIVFADYRLLQNDFPELREEALLAGHRHLEGLVADRRERRVRARIDRWLLRHGAWVSKHQTCQEEVNTAIETTGEERVAYRPPGYGRALVLAVGGTAGAAEEGSKPEAGPKPGLLDVKGAGAAPDFELQDSSYSNGLLRLDEALVEVAFQRLIDAALRHAGKPYRALPFYGVLDAGFDVVRSGQRVPAGLLLRRAHRRPPEGVELPAYGSPEQEVKLEIERTLRRYGITSANVATLMEFFPDGERLEVWYGGQPADFSSAEEIERFQRLQRITEPGCAEGINVQLSHADDPQACQLVDFGHYEVRRRFDLPIVNLVHDCVLLWGGAIPPESPDFVQPSAELQAPYEHWGRATDEERARLSRVPEFASRYRPEILAYELATGFRNGALTGAEVAARLDTLVATATDRWLPSAGRR